MAPKFVMHKVSCSIPAAAAGGAATNKDYFFLANPETYQDSDIGTACGVTEAADAEKATEVSVRVADLVASMRVSGLTVYGKDSGGKRHTHKVLCASDKEETFRATKVGQTYTFTNGAGTSVSFVITKIMRSRKTDYR